MPRVRRYRVVPTTGTVDWLNKRQKMVTASDVSALMGANPYKTREELLEEKRATTRPAPLTSRYALWGTMCELPNMEVLCLALGIRFRHTNMLLESLSEERLGCTLDGVGLVPKDFYGCIGGSLASSKKAIKPFIEDVMSIRGQVTLLEMKQVSLPHWNPAAAKGKLSEWTSRPPEHYWWQCQAQLLVTGLDNCLLLARIGAADWRGHLITADPLAHEEILEAVEEFWHEC